MRTLISDAGGFQFAHFAVAWKIKSTNLREIAGLLSMGIKEEPTRGSLLEQLDHITDRCTASAGHELGQLAHLLCPLSTSDSRIT